MVRKANPSSKTLVATFVAAAFGLTAGAAFAQTTTSHNARDEAAASSTAARHVTLSKQQSEQTISYSQARDLRICNLTGQTPSTTESVNAAQEQTPGTRTNLATSAPASSPKPVALQVSYGDQNERIQPGNCYEFQARNVHLSAAETLPTGSMLDVSIAQMSGQSFVNGRTEAASMEHARHSRMASKTSIKDLEEQLKQEDEQERQANAELSQARAKLAQTTRDLKQAQSKERHVASAERHTAKTARKAQHRVENAQPAQPESNAQSSSSSGSETPE